MANTVKMTKRDYFTALRAFVEGAELNVPSADVLAFIDNEIELLAKKANRASSKPTKAQTENENIKDIIISVLTNAEKPMTITEMMTNPELAVYSNQKLSALAKQLVDKDIVVKTTEKKKSYFSIAETAESDVEEEEIDNDVEEEEVEA